MNMKQIQVQISEQEQELLIRLLKFNLEILTDDIMNARLNNEDPSSYQADKTGTENILSKLK